VLEIAEREAIENGVTCYVIRLARGLAALSGPQGLLCSL
jgi:hypothetical protein